MLKRRVLAGLLSTSLVAAGLALSQGTSQASPPTGNLIVNPGAEATASGTAPSGWSSVGGTTTAEAYGTPTYPTVEDGAAIGGGTNMFYAGEVASDTIYQDYGSPGEDLSGQLLRIGADEGGFSSQEDNAIVVVNVYDATSTLLKTFQTDPVTAADRSDTTGFACRSAQLVLPVGAAKLRLEVVMTRVSGSADDGYADNIVETFDPTVSVCGATLTPSPSASPKPSPTATHVVVVPSAPHITGAFPKPTKLLVGFAGAVAGSAPITGYTVTAVAKDGSGTTEASGPASPIQLSGLRNNVDYTLTVTATTADGTSLPSAPAIGRPGRLPTVKLKVASRSGSKVTLTGTGTVADQPARNRSITLVIVKGKKTTLVKTGRTDSKGRFTFTITVKKATAYQVRLPIGPAVAFNQQLLVKPLK